MKFNKKEPPLVFICLQFYSIVKIMSATRPSLSLKMIKRLYLYIMSKLKKSLSFLSIIFLFTLLYSVGILLKPKHAQTILGEKPGFFEQWFEARKNADGIVPSWLRTQWSKWDRNQVISRNNFAVIDSIHEIGPEDIGGRTRAMWVDPTNDNLILACAISGGVWRTENAGATWKPVNDQEISLMPSCITANPFNLNEIYYGTGECRDAGVHNNGNGVFKSTDRGKTFKQLASTVGVAGMDAIWDIEHSLQDSNTIFVGTNSQGLYRSIDNGNTWQQVFIGGNKMISDILVLPKGRVIISQQSNAVYMSDSNGKPGTFVQITNFPSKPVGGTFRRIQMANCAKYPNVVYALFEGYAFQDDPAAFYKSSDGGKNWVKKTTPVDIGPGYQAYCVMLGVSAVDSNRVVAGGVSACYTTNGGTSWKNLSGSHSDHHSFVALRNKPNDFLLGTDGGIYKFTWGMGNATANLNNGYHVTQYYAGAYGLSGFNSVAGAQDNGTHYSYAAMNNRKIFGGDGAYCHIGMQDGSVAYVSYQNEGINRIDNFEGGFGNSSSIADPRFSTDGVAFINAYTMNLADQAMIFYRTNTGIYRSTDYGESWDKLNKSSRSGIKAMACSEDVNPVFYYGGSSGQIYKLENAATAAAGTEVNFNATVPASVTSDYINSFTINPLNKYQIFASFTTVSNQGRVWKVSKLDSVKPIWENISGNLPPGLPVNMVAVDPQDPENKIFAATDFGFYFTIDGGKNWQKDTRIPNVEIHEIKMRNSDRRLFLFTHGRGSWSIKLAPLSSVKKIKSNETQIKIFPNPVNNSFQIDSKIGESILNVCIYAMNGQLVMEQKSYKGAINTEKLKNGIYFVQVKTNNNSYTQKIKISH